MYLDEPTKPAQRRWSLGRLARVLTGTGHHEPPASGLPKLGSRDLGLPMSGEERYAELGALPPQR